MTPALAKRIRYTARDVALRSALTELFDERGLPGAEGLTEAAFEIVRLNRTPAGPKRRDPYQRFLKYVEKTETCWLWHGSKVGRGYGRLFISKEVGGVYAHRFSYEWHVGPIPDGLVLDHLCRVITCVRPSHLEPVTTAVNNQRGAAGYAARVLCKNNLHDITVAENIVVEGDGKRRCRECKRIQQQRRYDREKARRLEVHG